MDGTSEFLLRYGYVLIPTWVFAEQMGLPVPAAPLLLAAGALAGTGRLNFWVVGAVVLSAAFLSDVIWYQIGRRRGNTVLTWLCRLSFEPDSCARRTQNVYSKHGPVSLLVAKFVPWLNTAASPLAGAFGMPPAQFFLFDLAGSLLWAGAFLGTGYLFSSRLKEVTAYASHLGAVLLVLMLAGVSLALIVRRYNSRRRFLRQLAMSRITPEELKEKLDEGQRIAIIDLRHGLDFLPEPYTIPGAIRLPMEELDKRHQEIPRDREVIVYCTCPNEATSAMTALRLRRLGVKQVRPLAGGYFGWRKRGFPLDSQFGPVPPLRVPAHGTAI